MTHRSSDGKSSLLHVEGARGHSSLFQRAQPESAWPLRRGLTFVARREERCWTVLAFQYIEPPTDALPHQTWQALIE